ncbi:MAG: hypothetical protein IPL28_22685 [Chloroflexi bacterium]|nr:hypothetical protein [Chloroflexota bacterium]
MEAVEFWEPWSTGDDYNAAIGQGYITATPMQVAQMAAAIANGGFLYRPTVIHHLTDENGEVFVLNENLSLCPPPAVAFPLMKREMSALCPKWWMCWR